MPKTYKRTHIGTGVSEIAESGLMERDSCNSSFTTWIEGAIPNVSAYYDYADENATEEV